MDIYTHPVPEVQRTDIFRLGEFLEGIEGVPVTGEKYAERVRKAN